MFNYNQISLSRYWLSNLQDFYSWCERERQECKPTGACGQSMSTVEGMDGFQNKYPTFEDAYNEYMRQFEGCDE
ncbi:MAG: hypothetical protein ACOCZ5_03760 [bacterium]